MMIALMMIADFNFDGFSVDMTRSMVAMRDVSFPIVFQTAIAWFQTPQPLYASLV